MTEPLPTSQPFNPLMLACGIFVGLGTAVIVLINLWAFDPLITLLEQVAKPEDGSISEKTQIGIRLYLWTAAIAGFIAAATISTCSWPRYRLFFTPSRIFIALSVVVATLATLSVLGQYQAFVLKQPGYIYLNVYFNLDGERRIPTGFSSALLLSAALILALISYQKLKDKAPYIKSWCFLSLLFVYLAIDEAAKIHEEQLDFLMPILGIQFLHFWVIPVSALLVIFVLGYGRFLWNLSPRYRYLFVVSGAIYVGGAIGLETIGGLYAESYGKGNFLYQIIADVEEVFEMMGITLFIYTLHNYCLEFYSPNAISEREIEKKRNLRTV